MTQKTNELILALTNAILEKRALLITGNSGVGKTFLAKEVAKQLGKINNSKAVPSSANNVNIEILSCHCNLSYEDTVAGISPEINDGKMSFQFREKILLRILRKACNAFNSKKNDIYVLIIDDLQRNSFSQMFGEAMQAIGSNTNSFLMNNGIEVQIPPNFYVIATCNPNEITANQVDKEVLQHFYAQEVLPDISFITEDAKSDNAIWYERIRGLVITHLSPQYCTSTYEQNRYLLGHGYFSGNNIALKIKYQVIPLLRQYVGEDILDVTALDLINAYEKNCNEIIATNTSKTHEKHISGYKHDVTPAAFLSEDATSVPLENLIGRIIQQDVLPHSEIEQNILFNSSICYREKEENGVTYRGTLIADPIGYTHLCRSSGDHRKFYNAGTLVVSSQEYHFTGGMQPKEYTLKDTWTNEEPYAIGESTSPNVILFGIVRWYYKTLIEDLELDLKQNPTKVNTKRMFDFLRKEWESFLTDYKNIRPESIAGSSDKHEAARQKADSNKKANWDVRKRISSLSFLWKNKGDVISLPDGTEILIEGVERLMGSNMCKEYADVMNTLNIHQMILQGPPGTSKTYSAKEFLKYVAGNCSDDQVKALKISDYKSELENKGKLFHGIERPKLAWDIVQFHPSYGYEDFIRGIEVSTRANSSDIIYTTVNKVLGNIAAMAKKYTGTKFYLLIDEINRANLATVFGELIYGLEYRKEAVSTPYAINNDNSISLPENLYIIGTMNTADKSIGGIDYAIRRRFLFFEQLPDKNTISGYLANKGTEQIQLDAKAVKLFDAISVLFEGEYLSPEYRKEDVQIGHTYFLAESEEQLRMRFEYQIIPILKEYYKDGILSFMSNESTDGFKGLLNCISGKISISKDKKIIDQIFDDLIA